MCELLGFCAKKPTDIRRQLREFYSHSNKHPDGWGIMYSGGISRETIKASESNILGELIDSMPLQTTLLGHIRYATVGSIKLENCHPFTGTDVTGRQWTLIHNGTIYSSSRLVPYIQRQSGDTDSERMFIYMMEHINKAQSARPLAAEQRFELIDSMVQELAPRNKLNLMIYDGELMYIHKNMQDTMKYRRLGEGYIFATTEVDSELWQDVPLAQLIAFSSGEQVFSGPQHSGIFVPTLQYIQAMDAMNI